MLSAILGIPPPAVVDRRADALSREVMSPYCPQLLLADCRSAAAVDLRGRIRDALAGGKHESAVRAELVARFGERILAAPPARGFGLVAWLTPPAVLLGALATIARRLWSRPAEAPETPPARVVAPDLRRRLQDELRRS